MNSRISFVVASIFFGIVVAGCSSTPAKTEAEEKKAFLGGPMPKGFMDKVNSSQKEAQEKGMKAAQDAAAKAAAKNGG